MASQEEEAKNRRNTKPLALAHLSLLRELAMDSRRLLAIATICLAIAIIFATLVGAWMFRYECLAPLAVEASGRGRMAAVFILMEPDDGKRIRR
jgi:hypothetical protein